MRNLFHVPQNYFLSHSVGCLPLSAPARLETDVYGPWKSGENWAEWMGILETYRAGIGALIGAPAAQICPQVNISSGLTKLIFSLPEPGTRRTILLSPQDFPTIGFVLKQAERIGYVVRFVEGDPCEASNWAAAMDDSVGIVHITHALSNTSHVLPVGELCQMARNGGAISIVDVAQSLLAVPVDVAAWQPDAVLGTGVKFLCGGPGACFLYVSAEITERCEPMDVGWFSHENPFEMDIHNFAYADDAMRFFGGTPSPAPLSLANSALALWADVSESAAQAVIRKHIAALTKSVPQHVVQSPVDGSGGAAFVVEPEDRAKLRAAIEAAGVLCDERKEGFRFSLHAYTSDGEVARLSELVSGSV